MALALSVGAMEVAGVELDKVDEAVSRPSGVDIGRVT